MGSEISKWSDRAMFSAEKIDKTEGQDESLGVQPRVYLLDPPRDPLGHIAATCMMYEGRVIRDQGDITDAERRHYLEEIKRTKLQAPFEFFDLHFMIEGVSRGFTHQMVRQRTAVYAQESMRFAVKESLEEEMVRPPSLVGVTLPEHESLEELMGMALSKEQQWLAIWQDNVWHTGKAYSYLVNSGMPAEDARSLLPTNVATRLHYKTNLRNLIEHAGNRLCTQAQFEWRLVLSQLVATLRRGGENMSYKRRGEDGKQERYNTLWQYAELTDNLFKPACYLAGHCPFEANFDRHCSIRGRVRQFAEHGVHSGWWEEGARVDRGDTYIDIEPIRREEWLLDPAAARIK